MLEDGVRRLDQDAQDRHKAAYVQVPWEADRVVLLQGIEQTDFFKKLRSDLVVSLYNQEEVWPKFGYEGSSAEGRLHPPRLQRHRLAAESLRTSGQHHWEDITWQNSI